MIGHDTLVEKLESNGLVEAYEDIRNDLDSAVGQINFDLETLAEGRQI